MDQLGFYASFCVRRGVNEMAFCGRGRQLLAFFTVTH